MYSVGEDAILPNNKHQMCEKITKEKTGYKIYLEKSVLVIPLDTKPEILYKRGDSNDKTE